MNILSFGSLNLDKVYRVPHFVGPGETLSGLSLAEHCGGKGLNQSVAMAKAGGRVWHAGCVGRADGGPLLKMLEDSGVDTSLVRQLDQPTGHAIIQVDESGQNCILLYGGANQCLTEEYVDEVLSHFAPEDILLLQNEVNLLPYLVDKAYEKGMTIALNPSPFDGKLQAVDLGKISIFLLNEVEGGQITGLTQPEEILAAMVERFPDAQIVLTLGKDGALYAHGTERHFQPIFPVQAVDTTAAGDTFTGYFLAGLTENLPIPEVLRRSAKASAIAVTQPGAVPSIPWRDEVLQALEQV